MGAVGSRTACSVRSIARPSGAAVSRRGGIRTNEGRVANMTIRGDAAAQLFSEPIEKQVPLAKFLPGVLPYETIVQMVREEQITATADIEAGQFQPASLDLRLGNHAYRVRASFLPGANATVMDKARQMDGDPPLDL